MAERKVNGDDLLLFIDTAGGTSYDLVVCLTSNSFGAAVNEIDSKTKCGPDKAPGEASFNLSFEGQIMVEPGSNRMSTADLYTALINKTTVGWKFGPNSPVTGDVSYAATGFISKLDINAETEGRATFSASIGVYGTPTQTVT